MGTDSGNWHLALNYDQWVALSVSGQRPLARYKHAATVVDEKLYVAGGSRNGRYLSDVQVCDLRNLAWSTLKLNIEPAADKTEDSSQDVLPASSGHDMIKWGNKLLLLGGHSKSVSEKMTVRFIDLDSFNCGVTETFGKVPVARGGQSVTLVGSKLIMFGGEDKQRRLLNDVHVLDLETMTWDVLETTQTPPSPRFDHSAAVHAERYLLIFGGCSHSIFFNDLHVLDLESMEWSQPQIQGDLVNARAGHAGVTIDGNWYMVGGGDNRNGSPETIMLNMSKLVLSVLASVQGRDPLASEGLSVSSASLDGEKLLVAFGGYNGKYNNEVFVMRTKPRDYSHPKIFQSPAAAAAAASVTAAFALSKSGNNAAAAAAPDNSETEDAKKLKTAEKNELESVKINGLKEENKVLESSLAEVRTEKSRLKEKIEETTTTHAELSKELHSVQGQLVIERSRCAKLEAQITEVQKKLESVHAIEVEVQELRKQKFEYEREMENASDLQRQTSSSGGVWKWIAG